MPEPPAVFLDRDGVINRRRPDHVKRWEEFEFLPAALDALAEWRARGAAVVVITNQSAVGRGLMTADALRAIHVRMLRAIDAAGGHVSAIYACLHAPAAGCRCRKPSPLLFHRASVDLGIELSDSMMVGDSPTDVAAARAAGCRPVLLNGHGGSPDPDVTAVNDLSEAVMLWRELAAARAPVRC